MTDTGSNLEPGAIVPNQVEKVECHDVGGSKTQQEQREGWQFQRPTQDAEDGRDQEEGDQDFYNQKGPHEEGVEDRGQAEDGLEREGGQGGNVARAKEGNIDEEEEENCGAGVHGRQTADGVVNCHCCSSIDNAAAAGGRSTGEISLFRVQSI